MGVFVSVMPPIRGERCTRYLSWQHFADRLAAWSSTDSTERGRALFMVRGVDGTVW